MLEGQRNMHLDTLELTTKIQSWNRERSLEELRAFVQNKLVLAPVTTNDDEIFKDF